MNTNNFVSEIKGCADKLQSDMNKVCNVTDYAAPIPISKIPGGGIIIDPIKIKPGGTPLTLPELYELNALLATQGRDDFTPAQQIRYDELYSRYVQTGGTFPIILPVDPNDPNNNGNDVQGSFATHTIDNVHDLLNFIKASVIILMGASLNPAMIIPANIIVAASFVYAFRNQIKKLTFKINIHGHR